MLLFCLLAGMRLLVPGAEAAQPLRDAAKSLEAAVPAGESAALDGTLERYVTYALAQHPQVLAAYARWDADVQSLRGAAALPDPTVGIGLFVRAVETRVGPQQARISLQQSLPWPTELGARREGAHSRANESQARFASTLLHTRAAVHHAYWRVWEVRATRETHRTHLLVLDDLAATLRARIEVGAAPLSDLQQLDLGRARLSDGLRSLDAEEQRAIAGLRAAVGAAEIATTETQTAPPEGPLPAAELPEIIALAKRHPDLVASAAREEGATAALRMAKSQRMPGFTVGGDWIVTGPAVVDTPGSGNDALMVGLGLRLPLSQGRYAGQVRAADALRDAASFDAEALGLQVETQAEDLLVQLTDAARRLGVIRETFLPQAEGTYASLVGAYASGNAGVAELLLAHRDLLALQVQRDEARASLAHTWASLEALCGASLPPDEERAP